MSTLTAVILVAAGITILAGCRGWSEKYPIEKKATIIFGSIAATCMILWLVTSTT